MLHEIQIHMQIVDMSTAVFRELSTVLNRHNAGHVRDRALSVLLDW